MKSIIVLILTLHCGQGISDVTQDPSVLMAVKGSSVRLNCTHKKDISFSQMYWYRQRPGQTMTLIVFTSSLSTNFEYGDFDKNKFPAIKTVPESGSLTVNDVETEDSAVYFCSVSASSGDGVSQPGILWSLRGNPVQINCTHNKGLDYNQMYWYQQRKGGSLHLIVFTKSYDVPEFGDSDQSKFKAHQTVPERGTFTVKNSQPDDSAVYFCSVSKHSVSKFRGRCTKTPHILSKINNIPSKRGHYGTSKQESSIQCLVE
ncbi:uncharacterized protein LOC122362329 [Puntigrus tetrazona]|uniref:uncharacterized protein LOC122362329 n=1 Tax=Puntigrus tetrazona TaxID=1606681 RepID=UPI001C8AF8F0|nr:uncharacterized protein LOC122362329 [Puntigrus tetrazona]